ncbi:hypothetical protein [uncultured Dubosiella sp.]|uniref:hypothetical protein n=1 Tax=uncultured Dubosiella sp. TaxID=1937011 RepID=UPI0025B4F420|nr:hypothetical protein [uncultured Dubosiella sp.]
MNTFFEFMQKKNPRRIQGARSIRNGLVLQGVRHGDVIRGSISDPDRFVEWVMAASALSITLEIDPGARPLKEPEAESDLFYPIQYDKNVPVLKMRGTSYSQNDLCALREEGVRQLLEQR